MLRLPASSGAYRLSLHKRKSCRRFAGEHVSDQRTAHRARLSLDLHARAYQRRIGPEG